MFVMHTAREVAAALVGEAVDTITPSTDLGDRAPEALERLAASVADTLVREQVLDGRAEAMRVMPKAVDLPSTEVASVAEVTTRAAVRLLISTRLDVPYEELRPELHFALDLGADSLTRVDLVLLLEETLDVSVPDDSMFLVQSVGDAELFATLFDRTREEVVLSLGEAARDLTFDTPLSRFGDSAARVALDAATKASSLGFSLPDCPCHTLKDAVRLAFLTEKLRIAVATAAGVDPGEVTAESVPERDFGLDSASTRSLIHELTSAMDLGLNPVGDGHSRPLIETVKALAELSADETGGTPR